MVCMVDLCGTVGGMSVFTIVGVCERVFAHRQRDAEDATTLAR